MGQAQSVSSIDKMSKTPSVKQKYDTIKDEVIRLKFKDYKYVRPDLNETKDAFNIALNRFKEASSIDDAEKAIDQINRLRFDFNTMSTLAYIRNSIDTNDTFYDQEKDFFDQNSPRFSQLNNLFYQALVKTKFRSELEQRKGALLFKKAELSLTTFSPEIMQDLQEENILASQFQKLMASAQIEFEGKKRNLSQMGPFSQSIDRNMRKKASLATTGFLKQNEEKLDKIYDQLVHVRDKIAKTLGYQSFIELAYNRWGRTDYGPKDVAQFRKQVLEHVVPINTMLTNQKQKRLKLDTLYHYDLALEFESGNPTPKGDKDWMVKKASQMYQEMSPETDEFFTFMKSRELLDLEAKKGKAGGGYCTFIANYDSPFIFSNFNGTKGDVDVLTHEAGHAFQMYMSRHHEVPEYMTSSQDIMEIHSMSMEFFAWPWVHLFFEEDTEKYKYTHLTYALSLLAYTSAYDEFQHEIYANPELSMAERKAVWRDIDKKYFPYKVYDDNDYLERGNAWQNVMHLFAVPFYMIDYALAQVCALQYWAESRIDRDTAWKSYLSLCKAGGSDSYLGLLKRAQRNNPFEAGSLKQVMPAIKQYLESIDDTKL